MPYKTTFQNERTRTHLIDEEVKQLAKCTSPESFLRRHYGEIAVSRDGRSISIEKVLRADLKEGTWVSCDWYSDGIGDNINLVKWVLGDHVRFKEAIEEILGSNIEHLQKPILPKQERTSKLLRPKIPQYSGWDIGRQYLQGRGISKQTIQRAEQQHAINYVGDGVIFLGRNWAGQREARFANIRYYQPTIFRNGGMGNKRDLSNSDKTFPMVLWGSTEHVIIVEGGINALAAWQMTFELNGTWPCVVATGGVGIHAWLHYNPTLRNLIRTSLLVEIWGENEFDSDGLPDPGKQEKTDRLRKKLQDSIAVEKDGILPLIKYPPDGIKDAADWIEARDKLNNDEVEVLQPHF